MISDRKLAPKIAILPANYTFQCYNHLVQEYFRRDTDYMTIIRGMECHDGKWWYHVSCSKTKQKKLPSWKDLTEVKNIFIGHDKRAIQILPDIRHYVNLNPYCLHLFSCDDDGLPEFSDNGTL
jgi:hypothetical protein